jgi:acyl-CoA synthetase (AMP-forming)/AMP-acid ligase II
MTALTKLEYLRRFTQAERIAIRAAAAQSPVLDDYMQLMELATEVDTSDTDTVTAVRMLEQAGLIAAGRADEILGIEAVLPAPTFQKRVRVVLDGNTIDANQLDDGTVMMDDGKWSTVDALLVRGATVTEV